MSLRRMRGENERFLLSTATNVALCMASLAVRDSDYCELTCGRVLKSGIASQIRWAVTPNHQSLVKKEQSLCSFFCCQPSSTKDKMCVCVLRLHTLHKTEKEKSDEFSQKYEIPDHGQTLKPIHFTLVNCAVTWSPGSKRRNPGRDR